MYFYYNLDKQNPTLSKLISKVIPNILVIKNKLSIQSAAINLTNAHLIAIKVTVMLIILAERITFTTNKALIKSVINPSQPILTNKIA